MNIGIIILCRYNSSRLPGKILKELRGKPILSYIYERVKEVVKTEHIIVATSEQNSDDPIADFCKVQEIQCFRGELNNVAQRFLTCAHQHNLDFACRINGDNLFVDIPTLHQVLVLTQTNQYDFISNVKKRSFPKGMSIEMVRTTFYEQIINKFDTFHQEHVTSFIYANEETMGQKLAFVYNSDFPKLAGFQLAVDTAEDFEQAESILANFKAHHTTYNLKEINEIIERIYEP